MGLTVGAYGGRPADRVHVPRKSIGRQQPRALRHVADRPFTEKRVEFAEAPTGMAGDACRDAAAHLANDRLCGGTVDDFSSIILAHATSPFPDLQATLSRAVWHRSGKFNTVSALDSSDAECFGHRARDGLVIRQTRMRSPYLDPLLRSEAWVTWRAGACVHAGPRVHAAWLEPDAASGGLSVRLFMVLEQVGAPLDAWLANASNTLGPRAEVHSRRPCNPAAARALHTAVTACRLRRHRQRLAATSKGLRARGSFQPTSSRTTSS